MLSLLAKIFGPSRAVSLYVAGKRFAFPVLFFVMCVSAISFMLLTTSKERLEHVAYVEAEVIETAPLTETNLGAGIFVDVRLADGTQLKLTETEGAISRNLSDRACLEKRQDIETQEISYRLRLSHRCGF